MVREAALGRRDWAYDARAFDDARAMSHSRVGFVMMRERSARWPS